MLKGLIIPSAITRQVEQRGLPSPSSGERLPLPPPVPIDRIIPSVAPPAKRFAAKGKNPSDKLLSDVLEEMKNYDASQLEWSSEMAFSIPPNGIIGSCEALLAKINPKDDSLGIWFEVRNERAPVACLALRHYLARFFNVTWIGAISDAEGTFASGQNNSIPPLPSSDINVIVVLEKF